MNRVNKAQKAILVGSIILVVLIPLFPYWLEPHRWDNEPFYEEAVEVTIVAAILIFVFRTSSGETAVSEIQRLTKMRRLLGGVLLALVMPVYGPGHGLTILFQFSHFAYDAVTNNLGYFELPYVLGWLVAYYLASVLILFFALSSIVWIKTHVARNASS